MTWSQIFPKGTQRDTGLDLVHNRRVGTPQFNSLWTGGSFCVQSSYRQDGPAGGED